jgi:hypothetical protein
MKRTKSRYTKQQLSKIFEFNRNELAIAEENKIMREATKDVMRQLVGTSFLSGLSIFNTSWGFDSYYKLADTLPISRKRIKK